MRRFTKRSLNPRKPGIVKRFFNQSETWRDYRTFSEDFKSAHRFSVFEIPVKYRKIKIRVNCFSKSSDADLLYRKDYKYHKSKKFTIFGPKIWINEIFIYKKMFFSVQKMLESPINDLI